MGFILTFVILTVIITVFAWFTSKSSNRKENVLFASIACTIVSSIIIVFILFISYFTYVGAKKDYVNIQNTTNRLVDTYASYANVPTGTQAPRLASDLTDQKYEDYQKNLRYYVTKAYCKIEDYNDTVAGKEFMNQSWYWNWVIYYPEKLPTMELPALTN